MQYTKILFLLCLWFSFTGCDSDNGQISTDQESTTLTIDVPQKPRYKSGAEMLIMNHLDLLENKGIAIVANHTSRVFGETHLVDTLLALGINIRKVFAPEHGFRGTADAGEKVDSGQDPKTGLSILSLYGNNKKPSADQLSDVDLVVFDIQDVGSRHYTYISTMTYVMEACIENNRKMMVLDRINPNGWYVDGPIMGDCCQSFIGMHNVPIVHGMTIGEYAQMINEEGWVKAGSKVSLEVILCEGYDHRMTWEDLDLRWNPPSPNLGTEYAAYLYPALCWLEPTPVSVGRGTDDAFTIVGTPYFTDAAAVSRKAAYGDLILEGYEFTPRSLPGKSKYPKFQDETCLGYRFTGRAEPKALFGLGLQLLSDFYTQHTNRFSDQPFFKKGFQRWPGNTELQTQIKSGLSPEEIWQSWQDDVASFKKTRAKYLLYEDFE